MPSANAPTTASSPKTSAIAVVDDDDALRESLVWLLESVGLTSRAFASGDAFLTTEHETFGALLLDVRMPGMSGLQVQQQLVDQGSRLPLIMMTGHGDVPMAVAALKNGAFDFIEKPFNHQQLIDVVQQALSHTEQQHQQTQALARLQTEFDALRPKELDTQVEGGLTHPVGGEELLAQLDPADEPPEPLGQGQGLV